MLPIAACRRRKQLLVSQRAKLGGLKGRQGRGGQRRKTNLSSALDVLGVSGDHAGLGLVGVGVGRRRVGVGVGVLVGGRHLGGGFGFCLLTECIWSIVLVVFDVYFDGFGRRKLRIGKRSVL